MTPVDRRRLLGPGPSERYGSRSVYPQPFKPPHTSIYTHFPGIYLSRAVAFGWVQFESLLELNLYTLYLLFLKLPKILCKGKLFSFMLYLMKPNILLLLIKGGRRVQRQMMRSRLFASLREIICPPPTAFIQQTKQAMEPKFFTFFYFFFLFLSCTCTETKTNS